MPTVVKGIVSALLFLSCGSVYAQSIDSVATQNYTVGEYKGKVVYLNFAKQSLYTFPKVVFFSPKLKGVNVNDNQLKEFPKQLKLLRKLAIIKAKNNQLSSGVFESLPKKTGLVKPG